jgi:hypothetical protein
MMSGGVQRRTEETVAQLEIHTAYHGRGLRDHAAWLASIQAEQRRQASMLTGYLDLQYRLTRLEEAVRLIKVAAGMIMLALASSGAVGGSGAKVAKLLLGTL